MAAPPLPAGAAALAAGPSAHSTQCVREFERLQTKATSKFERLRQLAPSDTCDVTRQFSKAFSAFLELWVYQQRHRATLVTEGGLTRPDIGEIASRIGHLHYLWYLRCSDTRFLIESYTFYEAIHARQYFHETLMMDAPAPEQSADRSMIVEQQLRWYARFILVCIMLGKKEEAVNLLQEFQALVAAYTMSKDPETTHEWPLVLAEVGALLTADPGMPLPRSPGAALSFRPCCRVVPTGPEAMCAPHKPLIHHAVLVGYHHRQTKLAELPVDLLRVMQSLEWQDERLLALEGTSDGGAAEPHTRPAPTQTNPLTSVHGSHANLLTFTMPTVQGGNSRQDSGAQDSAKAAAAALSGLSLESHDYTQPAQGNGALRNPTRTLLYRTTAAQALSALHSASVTLPTAQPAVLLLYLSCASVRQRAALGAMGPSQTGQAASGTTPRGLPPVASVSCLTSSLAAASQPVCTDASGQDLSSAFCLSPLPRTAPRSSSSHTATATQCVLTPEDLRPLTRVPLMIVVDGDVAHTLRSLSGVELEHLLLALLSPRHRPSAFGDPTRTGQLFTLFLTLPVSAMCLIMGEVHDPPPHTLRAMQDAVDESLGQIASTLARTLSADTETAQSCSSWTLPFKDALLRQYVCRFVLARAALAYHRASMGRPECQPECVPDLPREVSPDQSVCVEAVMRIAAVLRRQGLFEGAKGSLVAAGAAQQGTGSAPMPAGLQAATQREGAA